MSDEDDTDLFTSPPFSFTGPIPPFFTRSHHRTRSTETPTDFPVSTPSLPTSFDVSSPPPLTQTDDPTETDAFPSSTGTLDTPTPTSGDPDPSTLISTDIFSSGSLPADLSSSSVVPSDSFLTIDPSESTSTFLSDSLSPTSTPDFFTSTSSDDPFSSSIDTRPTADPSSTSDSTLTTSDLPLTTPPLSSSPTPSLSSPVSSSTQTPSQLTSSPVPLSQISSSRSSPSLVTTTSFPSFGSGASPQSNTSTTSTGTVVAATTGAIALAIVLALLAILCRKRHLKKLRQRDGQDPFLDLDLDGEMVAVNQPLILGEGPGPAGAVYSDRFTDDSRQRTQSRSVSATTGPAPSLARSSNSYQAVVGSSPTPDLRGGMGAGYRNQHPSSDHRSPPPQLPPSGITRARSPSVQAKFPPESPVPRQSSPSFDAGAVAYLRNDGQTVDTSPPNPLQVLPGNAEDDRLISAFSAASGLSPRHSTPVPPPNIDEMWRNSPDPIQASSSYRSPVDRGRSFTPSVSGYEYEPGDTMIISPLYSPTQGPTQSHMSTGPDAWDPYAYDPRGGNLGSRPSPITEVSEIPTHSQEGSNNSGKTWDSTRSVYSSSSLPVVMHAQRIRVTPTALSVVSPPKPPSPPLPPLPTPVLPQVKPLSLGKRRSAQGAS